MALDEIDYSDSRHDEITGLFSRLYMRERLDIEFRRARRYREPLTCLCVAIDRLPELRERHGTEFGDKVLRHVAAAVRGLTRDVDFVARGEGDELLIVLPNTPLGGGVIAGEKAVNMVTASPLDGPEGAMRVTVSVGVASYLRAAMRDEEDLLAAAREALGQAQQAGRNRVVEMPIL